MGDLGVIVLAAGLGKRMRSSLPKVLHQLGGRPLLFYPLQAARSLKPTKTAIVIGHGADGVKRAFSENGVTWIFQEKPLGTGHAVRCAKEIFEDFSGDLLILSGDVPLISQKTLKDLLDRHRQKKAALTFVTAHVDQPSGYGRVLRNNKGEIVGIVEERDATEDEKKIGEINAGIYAAAPGFLFTALNGLCNQNQQGEYYLPDIVGLALERGEAVETVHVEDAQEILGINTREELAMMEKRLQEKVNRKWMEAGVTLKDPQTTYIDEGVSIGKDTIIGPNTHLLGKTEVGERCRIDGNAYVTDCQLGDGVHLRFSVVMTGSRIEDGAIVGPFSHLRPGTVLGRNVHVGNFVEVKNSRVGEATKANHLSYIGDANVGRETNIGAGTITCNYDGFDKHTTKIGDRVQIGSDTQLVAPVAVGDDAYIGAGSTITEDVPPGVLALSRVPQKHVAGWVKRFREKKKKGGKR